MGTKYFVDPKTGVYLGGFNGALPPDGAQEVDGPPMDGRDVYDFSASDWIPYEPSYTEKRLVEYQQISLGDQLDAIYKGLDIVIPALIEGRKLTAEEAALLEPDKTQPVDTPAGWRGKVKDIKERNPKD